MTDFGECVLVIVLAFIGIVCVIGSHIRDLIKRKKWNGWIPYWEVVDSNGKLEICPKCKKSTLESPWLDVMIRDSICDIYCQKCNHYFVEYSILIVIKGFQVMNLEEYQAWREAQFEKGYRRKDLSLYLKKLAKKAC